MIYFLLTRQKPLVEQTTERSYLFGVVSTALFAFYTMEMKRSLQRLMQAFIAHNVDFVILQLLRKIVFGSFDLFVNLFDLIFAEGIIRHTASRTIQILQHF